MNTRMEHYIPRSKLGRKEVKTKAKPAVKITVVTEEDTKGLPVSLWGVKYLEEAKTGKVRLEPPSLVSALPQLLVYLFLAHQNTKRSQEKVVSFVGRSYVEQAVAQTIRKNKGEIRDKEWQSVLDIAQDIKKGVLDMVVNVPVDEWSLQAVLRRCNSRFRSALMAAIEKKERVGSEGKEDRKQELLIALAGTITHMVKKAEDWVTMIAKCQGDWDDIARLNVEGDLKFDKKRLKLQPGTFKADLDRYLSARSQRINARLKKRKMDKGIRAKADNTKKSKEGTLNPRAQALNANKRKVDLQPKRMKTKRLSDLPAYSVKQIRAQTKAQLVQAVRSRDTVEESVMVESGTDVAERIPSVMHSELTPKAMLPWGNMEIRMAITKAYESSESTEAIRNRVLQLGEELPLYHRVLLYLAYNSVFSESLPVRDKVQEYYGRYSGLETQWSSWRQAKQIMRLTGIEPDLRGLILMYDHESINLYQYPDDGMERNRHITAQQEIQARINQWHEANKKKYAETHKSQTAEGENAVTTEEDGGDNLLKNLFDGDA